MARAAGPSASLRDPWRDARVLATSHACAETRRLGGSTSKRSVSAHSGSAIGGVQKKGNGTERERLRESGGHTEKVD